MTPYGFQVIRGFQKLPAIQKWQYCHLCFSCAIWNLIGHQNFLAWNIILLYLVIYNFAFTKTIWLELSRKLQMCANTQMAILSILSLLPMLFICWKPRLFMAIPRKRFGRNFRFWRLFSFLEFAVRKTVKLSSIELTLVIDLQSAHLNFVKLLVLFWTYILFFCFIFTGITFWNSTFSTKS